jgi:hypothetical protein
MGLGMQRIHGSARFWVDCKQVAARNQGILMLFVTMPRCTPDAETDAALALGRHVWNHLFRQLLRLGGEADARQRRDRS